MLKIPKHIDLEPGVKLSNSFYKDGSKDNYKGFKQYKDIYFDREHFQTEHVLLDQNKRREVFPKKLSQLCDQMNDLGIIILKNVFSQLSFDKSNWDRISGNCSSNNGTHWFASSHYRSYLDLPGCAPHKDTGFITVLYIDQTGLEAYINNEWVSIEPIQGYFVINFGASMEVLTKYCQYPIKAIYHRVRQIKNTNNGDDRFSFASFLNPPASVYLYQYKDQGSFQEYMSVEKFLDDFNKNTWKGFSARK